MPTATKTITLASGTNIKIALTRDVQDDVAYADGYNITVGRKIYERTEIVLHTKDGKIERADRMRILKGKLDEKHIAQGAYAQIGNGLIRKNTYDQITAALAELDTQIGKSDEYLALKQAEAERKARGEENLKRMEVEMRQRESSPGWCKKCKDWTYGDCGHRTN